MTNPDRDAFLDWYAAHRCQPHDERWEYCKSEAHRGMGVCIELSELIPKGEVFEVDDSERAAAATEFWPRVAQLLGIISQITHGEWHHLVSSREAIEW